MWSLNPKVPEVKRKMPYRARELGCHIEPVFAPDAAVRWAQAIRIIARIALRRVETEGGRCVTNEARKHVEDLLSQRDGE